jgi:ribonuclease ZC3H12
MSDPNESSLSSCSSSSPISLKPFHHHNEIDSGCGSDDDPTLVLKINKGLSMGYDYELIKSVIQQQNDGDDMSKFIETIVRKAEMNSNSITLPSPIINHTDTSDIPHDIYIIDGADLAYSYGNNLFSWRGIEICLKYLHSHGHKKVYVVLPYSLKHHRHEQNFSESKFLRDLERKNLLIYTNRLLKQTTKSNSYTHINEMLKFSQKMKGYLITNVSLKDVILDFTIYKKILEEKIIRYRFQNDLFHFQPLLVTIVNGNDGNDCEIHYPLCPYGKKCTYGSKCKYFHIEQRNKNSFSISENLQMKANLEKSRIQNGRRKFLSIRLLLFF